MKNKKIAVIGSQMDMGAVRKGVDMGSLAIRHSGLIAKIRDCGYSVKDYGDIFPMVATSEGSAAMRYEKEINESNKRLFDKVLEIHKENTFPVILGGDHSIAAGSVAATAEHYGKIGVIWVDAHGDFNDDKISPPSTCAIHRPYSSLLPVIRLYGALFPGIPITSGAMMQFFSSSGRNSFRFSVVIPLPP